MKKLLSMALSAVMVAGCGSANMGTSAHGKLERWTTFDGKTISLPKMGDKQATVYFYREKGAIDGPAVNVFIDGDYLASVLDGGYRAGVICSTGERLPPNFTTNKRFADRDTGVDYNFEAGKVHYVKIVLDDHKRPVFQRVSVQEGARAVRGLRQETQTLPRVKDNRLCNAAVLEKVTLDAGSLFKFDKSDYGNMLAEGKEQIKEVGRRINEENQMKIKAIKVDGYTDPMGSDDYNLSLSRRRAQTVKAALKAAGVRVPIEAQGFGESNLIVRDCLKRFGKDRKQRMACDQVNRRVEIILYGNRMVK